jgi:hypothetical protein
VWIVVFVAIGVGLVIWFVRTPLFRAHLRSGKDPGDAGTRVEGKFPGNGGGYVYDDRPRD